MASVLPYILIGLIALILMGMLIALVSGRKSGERKRVMNVIKGHGGHSGDKAPNEKQVQDKRRAEIAKKLKDAREEDEKSKGKKKTPIALRLGQAGLSITVRQFWIYSAVSMVVCTLLAKLLGMSPFVILMAAITGLLGVPRLVLRFLIGRRQKKFLEEFADALEAMVRLLKAGMPVSECVLMISREFEGPVGEEMSRVYDKQKIGVPLHEAALEATKRMPLTEMQMFATGLSIQAQTGSSLSEVLMNLAAVIRARFKLKRKIKALSSEAIASAGIIGALPVIVAGGMYFINYDYISVLFTDSFGKILLTGAVIWMSLGILVMKIMINFKV